MKYPKYTTYKKLYKRFFLKGTEYLSSLVKIKPTDKVLDMCGGDGRLTKELTKHSKFVHYLDQEKDMIPKNLKDLEITVHNTSVENFLEEREMKFNIIFCQQAVNYWLLNIDVKKLADIIEDNGFFIFNTFSRKPSAKPSIKEYSIDNIYYLELSYLAQNKVNHIQIMEGLEPHFTQFDWIPKNTYKKLLSPYFDVELKDDGKTSIYICKKKQRK